MMDVILQLTGKRKQALLESNLSGISCSTGMVKEGLGNTNPSFQQIIPRAGCLKKTQIEKQRKHRCFILLSGPKKGGAYT